MYWRFKLKPPKELVTVAFTAALLLSLCALLEGRKPEKGAKENSNVTKQEDDRERVVQSNIEFQSNMEFWKATHDYFEQYATISLASIAAFAVLLGGAFANPPDDANLGFITCFAPEWFGARPWIFGGVRGLFIVATFVAFRACFAELKVEVLLYALGHEKDLRYRPFGRRMGLSTRSPT